jgi:hypothetical protein
MGREFKTEVSQPAFESATPVDPNAVGQTIIRIELALNLGTVQTIRVQNQIQRIRCRRRGFRRRNGDDFESKVNKNATGTPSPVAIDSSFSKEGAFLPRSIRLKKSTDIPIISAKSSWLFPRSWRIWRTRSPNCFRRVSKIRLATHRKCGVISFRVPPNQITGRARSSWDGHRTVY